MSFKLLVANWKMNPSKLRKAILLARAEDARNVIICPPFPFIQAVKKTIKKASLGAQDVFWENSGAYTGEISPLMLKNLNIEYVIVGHSERRNWLGETDRMINKKLLAALDAGLKIILCVGETKRESGIKNNGLITAKNFVKRQILENLKSVQNSNLKTKNSLIIAYEPVWAIGTGKPDKPEETLNMAIFIKGVVFKHLGLRDVAVLYGGSVDGTNVINFLQYKEINGALVGGASLNGREFKKIINLIE